MAKTLVLGLGNILLGDEGVGVRVVERLRARYELPEGIQVMDGGTLGLDLLPYLKGTSRLLVVDAVQAGKAPGTLLRLEGKEIPILLDLSKVSPHQDGLQDLLAAAALTGCLPEDVVLCGVQIDSLRVGLELSPPVAAQVDALVERVAGELNLCRPEIRSLGHQAGRGEGWGVPREAGNARIPLLVGCAVRSCKPPATQSVASTPSS
jgi:hydrogenase maturation protease